MLPRAPFITMVLFFLTGILLGEYILPGEDGVLLVAAAFMCISLTAAIVSFKKRKPFTGYIISLFLVLAGLTSFLTNTRKLQNDLNVANISKCEAYEAIVKSLPEKRAKTLRLEIAISKMKVDREWKNCNVKALVNVPIDADVVPEAGQRLVISGAPERPAVALNPEEFNYRRYLWNKGIVWTDYLPEGSYQILKNENHSSALTKWTTLVSQWADKTFRKHIQDDRSYGLVKAMLLGRRDDLRADQVNDYTTSGTVHILSVSGMHVAIIFMALSKMTGWLKRLKGGRYIYLIILTSLLSFYALVTGLPPSVQRATAMCIVLIVAETFERKHMSMNTLAISALLILAADPHALFDLGFQLSFLAMAGIFLFYDPMASFWQPSHFILKFFWQITALSFAAQLATFPLSLYYFHQFPFYFWLVNPFVIFFTNILLPASMVLLLFSLLPVYWLQALVDGVVHWSALLTNISVAIPKQLPGYLINNLYLDTLEVAMLYGFMFGMWYAYHRRNLYAVRWSIFLGLIYVGYSLSQSVQTYYSSTAMVHSVPRHSVISFKEGDKLFIVSDSLFLPDKDAYNFRIKNYAISQGVLETVYLSGIQFYKGKEFAVRATSNGEVISWKDKFLTRGLPMAGAFDYALITSGNPAVTSPAKQTTYLIGGEIRGRKFEKWKDHFAFSNQAFHDLNKGALLLP
jgi:competence protein ComEC